MLVQENVLANENVSGNKKTAWFWLFIGMIFFAILVGGQKIQAESSYQTGIQYVQPLTNNAANAVTAANNTSNGDSVDKMMGIFQADKNASDSDNINNFVNYYAAKGGGLEYIQSKITYGFLTLYGFMEHNIILAAFLIALLGVGMMLISMTGLFRRGFATGLKITLVAYLIMIAVPSLVTIGIGALHFAS